MISKTFVPTIALTAGAIASGQTMEVRVSGVLSDLTDPPPHYSPLAGIEEGDTVEWVFRYDVGAVPEHDKGTGTVYPGLSKATLEAGTTVCQTAEPGAATVLIHDEAPGATPRDVFALSAHFGDVDHALLLHAADLDATAFDGESLPGEPMTLDAFEHVALILFHQTSPSSFGDEVGRYALTEFAMRLLPVCPADLDGDGRVGASDLGLLIAAWGAPDADLDGDGLTGPTDLGLLLAAWGAC